MPRRFIIGRHARQRMARWRIGEREVTQVFRHPDSVGVSYQTGRELRSAELDGRLITLVLETAGAVTEVWTVWADVSPEG